MKLVVEIADIEDIETFEKSALDDVATKIIDVILIKNKS